MFLTVLFSILVGMIVGSILTMSILAVKSNEPKDDGKTSRSLPFDEDSARSTAIDRSVMTVSKVEREGLLTGLLAQLWDHINAAGCQIVREAVEPALKENLPAPLNTMHFTKLDLGKIPLRLDNIVVHEKTDDGVVQFDLDVVWDGQCEIELKADYVGSVGVKTIKFKGRMAVIFKPLKDVLPVAGAVQYFFIDPPMLKLDFTGLAQMADMTVISRKIRSTIDDIISSMLVLPNRMMTKLDETVSFLDIYQPPVGVARIYVIKGEGFVNERRTLRAHDVPDVYCNISIGTSPVWKTKTSKDTLAPVWARDEFADFLLFDYRQTLTVNAWDEDTGTIDSDDDLGCATVTVQQLLLAAGNRTLTLNLKDMKGNASGASITIRCDLLPLTTSTLTSLTIQKASPRTMGGLLTILVNKAVGIPAESSSFVKVTFGPGNEFTTGTIAPAPAGNPCYESVFRVPLTTEQFLASGGRHDVVLEVYQPTDKETKLLGKTVITHSELVGAPNTTIMESREIGNGISLEFQVSLQGLNLEGAPLVARANEADVDEPTRAPVAVERDAVRLTAIKGRGFQVEKRRMKTNDIPDVYLKIKVGTSSNPWKTSTINNSTEPEWNEQSAFLASDSDMITIEAFDYDKGRVDADDFLGSAEVTVGKLLLSGGTMNVELKQDGKATGAFITLRCEKVGSVPAPTHNETTTTTSNKAKSETSKADETTKVPANKVSTENDATLDRKAEASARAPPTDMGKVSLKAVKGRGFQIEKRLMKNEDTPDVYLNIKVGSLNKLWKTSTIGNSTEPVWNEVADFFVSDKSEMIIIDAFDYDKGIMDKDDELGSAQVSIGKLLSAGGAMEVELELRGKVTGAFITLHCGKAGSLVVDSPNANETATATLDEAKADDVDTTPKTLKTTERAMPSETKQVEATPNETPSIANETTPVSGNEPAELGNVSITAVKGRGFQIEKRRMKKDDIPDVYLNIKVGGSNKPWKTSTFTNNTEPEWNESTTFWVSDESDMITIDAFDCDKGKIDKDDELGSARLTVGELFSAGGTMDVELKVDGEATGAFITLRCGKLGPVVAESASANEAATTMMGEGKYNNDDDALEKETSHVNETATTPESKPDTDDDALPDEPVDAPAPDPPAYPGKVRLTAVKGRGFQIEKRLMKKDDIPDVYLNIKVGSTGKPWKTSTIDNNTEPEWNESAEFHVADSSDMITIDAFDYDKGRFDDDDFLGNAQVTVGKLLLAGGTIDMELQTKGKPNGAFITLSCQKLS
jgi:Ca2+-dependent lipid-binding protein